MAKDIKIWALFAFALTAIQVSGVEKKEDEITDLNSLPGAAIFAVLRGLNSKGLRRFEGTSQQNKEKIDNFVAQITDKNNRRFSN